MVLTEMQAEQCTLDIDRLTREPEAKQPHFARFVPVPKPELTLTYGWTIHGNGPPVIKRFDGFEACVTNAPSSDQHRDLCAHPAAVTGQLP